ncbi:MAG: hypothetical protein ABJB12_15765 [Pseudomonadota bacterium]
MTRHDSNPELPLLEPQEEERLSALLRHAFAPGAIDNARHELLLLAALEDPFAEPSAQELVQSERLRHALEGAFDHADLALARALANAHAPSTAAPEVDTPLDQEPLRASDSSSASAPPNKKSTVYYVRFAGIAAGLAAAAGLLLAVQSRTQHALAPDLPTLALAQSRSTAALFQTAAAERPSARIDRIASVRERDLRDNRYALWGVR